MGHNIMEYIHQNQRIKSFNAVVYGTPIFCYEYCNGVLTWHCRITPTDGGIRWNKEIFEKHVTSLSLENDAKVHAFLTPECLSEWINNSIPEEMSPKKFIPPPPGWVDAHDKFIYEGDISGKLKFACPHTDTWKSFKIMLKDMCSVDYSKLYQDTYEPVVRISNYVPTYQYTCNICGGAVDRNDNYCPLCGGKFTDERMMSQSSREPFEITGLTTAICSNCKHLILFEHKYCGNCGLSLKPCKNSRADDNLISSTKPNSPKSANNQISTDKNGMDFVGKTLAGKYLVTEMLTPASSSNAVFLAEELSTGLMRSIKVINTRNIHTKLAKEMYEEMTAKMRVRCYGVNNLLDMFSENEYYFCVREYFSGKTLSKYLEKRGGRLSEEESIWITLELLKIMRQLYSQGVYLDLAELDPLNIFITDTGLIKLSDYSIFFRYDTPPDTCVSYRKRYCPFEAFSNCNDLRSVVFTLGMLMFHYSTGIDPTEFPYYGPNERDCPVSKGLEKVLQKSTKNNPKERYQSLEKMERALLKLSKPSLLKRIGLK